MPLRISTEIIDTFQKSQCNDEFIQKSSYKIPTQKKAEFQERLKDIFTPNFRTELCGYINDLAVDINTIITTLNENLCNIGNGFIKKTFVQKKQQPRWFDNECGTSKRKKYRALRSFRLNRSTVNLIYILSAKKILKHYVTINSKNIM